MWISVEIFHFFLFNWGFCSVSVWHLNVTLLFFFCTHIFNTMQHHPLNSSWFFLSFLSEFHFSFSISQSVIFDSHFEDSPRKVCGNCSNLNELPLICIRVGTLALGWFLLDSVSTWCPSHVMATAFSNQRRRTSQKYLVHRRSGYVWSLSLSELLLLLLGWTNVNIKVSGFIAAEKSV